MAEIGVILAVLGSGGMFFLCALRYSLFSHSPHYPIAWTVATVVVFGLIAVGCAMYGIGQRLDKRRR
jgi:hypothetical protein